MDIRTALETLLSAAELYGSNAEEAFRRRVKAEDTDEICRSEIADPTDDAEVEDVLQIRDLWRAVEVVNAVLEQKGCEHFDPAVTDGQLTTLMEIVIYG